MERCALRSLKTDCFQDAAVVHGISNVSVKSQVVHCIMSVTSHKSGSRSISLAHKIIHAYILAEKIFRNLKKKAAHIYSSKKKKRQYFLHATHLKM